MTDRELLQMAYKAMDAVNDYSSSNGVYRGCFDLELKLLNARLAQPEPEPTKLINVNGVLEKAGYIKKKEWVGLTATEIKILRRAANNDREFAELVQAKLKEKSI